jgi:hypothetical protein
MRHEPAKTVTAWFGAVTVSHPCTELESVFIIIGGVGEGAGSHAYADIVATDNAVMRIRRLSNIIFFIFLFSPPLKSTFQLH